MSSKVLLSIKPEFAEKIFSGDKKYEYRRLTFKKHQIQTIVVYASSPIKKVVGEFEIEEIILDNLDSLWENTRECSGISKDFFYNYFKDKEYGYAIKIGAAIKYSKPICLQKKFNILPPQSFVYL